MESSRRELSIGVAGHRSILKHYQSILVRTTPFWFHIQNRYSVPLNGDFVFTVYLLKFWPFEVFAPPPFSELKPHPTYPKLS